MTDAQLYSIGMDAMANFELDPEEASPDAIADEAYTLAFDAIFDRCGDRDTASRIAGEVAQSIANP